jgi:hypothetical protein
VEDPVVMEVVEETAGSSQERLVLDARHPPADVSGDNWTDRRSNIIPLMRVSPPGDQAR